MPAAAPRCRRGPVFKRLRSRRCGYLGVPASITRPTRSDRQTGTTVDPRVVPTARSCHPRPRSIDPNASRTFPI
jgi:hypothetical protein